MPASEALARKNSRELVQKLIEEDRVKSEGIKAESQLQHPVRGNSLHTGNGPEQKVHAARAGVSSPEAAFTMQANL